MSAALKNWLQSGVVAVLIAAGIGCCCGPRWRNSMCCDPCGGYRGYCPQPGYGAGGVPTGFVPTESIMASPELTPTGYVTEIPPTAVRMESLPTYD